MPGQETALRKRQQIADANRMMFLWVAGVSAVVGIAVVASIFLLQKAWFNEKVLAAKADTASTLVENNEVIGELKNQVRVLNTNQALKDSMLDGQTQPVQVVLDALPDTANSSALGASLQEKFLDSEGISLESLNVDPIEGIESDSNSSVQDASSSSAGDGENTILFRFAVSSDSSNPNALKDLLQRLERSIRPINITSLTIETQGERLVMEVSGLSYYEPARTVELKTKTIKP